VRLVVCDEVGQTMDITTLPFCALQSAHEGHQRRGIWGRKMTQSMINPQNETTGAKLQHGHAISAIWFRDFCTNKPLLAPAPSVGLLGRLRVGASCEVGRFFGLTDWSAV